jgi:hypothetical protein
MAERNRRIHAYCAAQALKTHGFRGVFASEQIDGRHPT